MSGPDVEVVRSGPQRQASAPRPASRWGPHGSVVLIICAVSFAVLAFLAAFAHGFLLRLDGPVDRALDGVRTQVGLRLFNGITDLGSAAVVAVLLAVAVLLGLLPGRCRRTAVVLVLAFGVTVAIREPIKELVGRPRPILDLNPAFPSGHTVMATWFFGMLSVLVSVRLRRGAAILGAVLAVVVGFSRMILGVHWLTDAVGGFLLGAVLVLATYRLLDGHRLEGVSCPLGAHGPPPGGTTNA